LHEHAAFERHYVEVAVAREGNAFAVLREARVDLDIRGLCELCDLAGVVVEGEEVTGIGVDHQALVPGGVACRGG
jgi:hypothetical protein